MKPRIELMAYQPAVCDDGPTTVQLLVRLHAPKPHGDGRPPLNIGLSIDRSGSMGGQPIARAIQASTHVVEQLEGRDSLSVVAFCNLTEVVADCPSANCPEEVVRRLQAITANGGTALYDGWLHACQLAEQHSGGGRLSRVLLLSDGQANQGVIHPLKIAEEVARWQGRGITTTTIGLGTGYNEDLLSAMAKAGNGSFYHVQTPEDILSAFQVEMLGLSATYGQAVSLGIEPAPGVEVIRVVNLLDKTLSGRLKLADLVHGCPIDLVLELQVPPQKTERELCRFRLAWTERESELRRHLENSLQLPVVPRGQLSEFPVNPLVAQKHAHKLSARLLSEAIQSIDQKDIAGARAKLQAGLNLLKEADSNCEIADSIQQFQTLLQQLDGGQLGSVRKHASYASSSVSMGSVSMSGSIRRFLALPPDQRTPEKFEELRNSEGLW